MASIPILAAVAAAIIVPVAGTGIYYSVKSSNQEESTQQKLEKTRERPTKQPQFSGTPVTWGTGGHNREHGFTDVSGTTSNFIGSTPRLNTGRFGTAEQSLQPFIERSTREKNEAIEDLNRALRDRSIPELPGVSLPNSATLRKVETHSVNSHSSFSRQ